MKNEHPLFDLHHRIVRARRGGRGIRLSEFDLSLLIEETEMLDQLWAKLSEKLKSEGYPEKLVKASAEAKPSKGKSGGTKPLSKVGWKKFLYSERNRRIEDHELPDEPFEISIGNQVARTKEQLRNLIYMHRS